MTGLIIHPLRLAALDRMAVLRVPVTKQTSRVNSCPWEYLDWKMVWIDPGLGNGPYLKVSAKDGETVHRVYPRMEAGDRFVKEAWSIATDFGYATDYIFYRATYVNGGIYDDVKKWQPARSMPEHYARYIVTLGPPVPCRLGEVDVVQQRDEGVIPEIGDEYRRTWDALYPKHPFFPDRWTWGYPMEVRR